MAKNFGVLPKDIPGKPKPFTLRVSDEALAEFLELLRLSKIGPATWWNQYEDHRFGVSRKWLSDAKEAWLTAFDWRKHEERINSFPNFKMTVQDQEAGEMEIHFAALFSAKEDAIPVIFMHGFPSAFTDFLPMMQLLADKYTPETLPYHIIVPSLPDYGLSGSPNRNVETTLGLAARIMNQLMIDLGFGGGYVAQGGDLGCFLARLMSAHHKECKAFHINLLVLESGDTAPSLDSVTTEERVILERTEAWRQTGLAYALEHGTRPATVGLTMSSSPLALLAWVGEKLVEWVDPREPLPLDSVLAMVTLYWFTDTLPRSLYHAELARGYAAGGSQPISKEKPFGYSLFPYDLAIMPHAWVKQVYPNLVSFNSHGKGGHFASVEQPQALLDDVEEFVGKVYGLFQAE